MNEELEQTEYWFAKSGRAGLGRMHYGVVHWKGFVVLFATIMGGIWLLLGGVLLVVFGWTEFESIVAKIAAAIVGTGLVVAAITLAWKSFQALRKRVDPVRTSPEHLSAWFGKRKE